MTCHSGCHPGAAIYQFRRRFSNLSRIFVTNRVFCDLTTLRRLAISSHLDKERFVSAREREREREKERQRGGRRKRGGATAGKETATRSPYPDPRLFTSACRCTTRGERDITALLSRFYYDTQDAGDRIVKSEPLRSRCARARLLARSIGETIPLQTRAQEWHAE